MGVRGRADLSVHGIHPSGEVIWDATPPQLYEHAIVRGEARIAEGGPLVVDTGTHTGRSPQDKFVVREPESEDRIWWGDVNRPLGEQAFDRLREKVAAHLGEHDLYVVDALAGA